MAQQSFVEFARTLTEQKWGTRTPCTPAWTVRDVLSHVAGVPDDALAGRMDGAPGEAWTAASQVERNSDIRVDELLDRWASQAEGFAEALEAMGENRPPFDCHSHEHDIRQALDRPGNRSNEIIETGGFGLATVDGVAVRMKVELDDGRVVLSGDPTASTEVHLRGRSTFELFRSRLGRRSREQVRAYAWTGTDSAIDTVIATWFRFGPSPLPIFE